MNGIDAEWDTYVAQVKASVWGYPKPQEPDAFYSAKFSGGEVVPGWSHAKWTLDRMAGIPLTSSRGCHRATR